MKLIFGLLIGTAFGFIIHRAGASQYENLVNTLRLKNLKILKFMILSIVVGMVGIYFLNIFGLANLGIKSTYVLGVTLGGLIFGVGFALAGYCPGTAICALGEGKKDAFFAILGGLAGALAYSLVYPYIKPVLIDQLNYGKITFANIIPLPQMVVALLFAGLIGFAVYKLPQSISDRKQNRGV